MKYVAGYCCLLLMLFITPGASGAQWPTSCGPLHTSIHVKKKNSVTKLPSMPAGAARLVFVQSPPFCGACMKVQVGVDGKWVGVNQGKSWFAVAVPAGEHHVCTWWDTRIAVVGLVGRESRLALTDLNAEAGHTYYFETHIKQLSGPNQRLVLRPISSDEGKLLVPTLKEAVATFKAKRKKK